MKNNKRLIQAAKALRRTGFHFNQFQCAGIHCSADGTSKERQNGIEQAGEVAVALFSPMKGNFCVLVFVSAEVLSGRMTVVALWFDRILSLRCGLVGRWPSFW